MQVPLNQPGTACLSGQSTAEKELVEYDHLQWWTLCLPTDLVGSVASEAATVLQRAAQLWTEEDLQEMVSSDHSLGKMMGGVCVCVRVSYACTFIFTHHLSRVMQLSYNMYILSAPYIALCRFSQV